MESEYLFSDYIEIVTSTYDLLIFTPAYSKELGLYLYNDNYEPIKNIFLMGSKLLVHYVSGSEEFLDMKVEHVVISGNNFEKKMGFDIEDVLFRYGINETMYYDTLDKNKAYNSSDNISRVKKRS